MPDTPIISKQPITGRSARERANAKTLTDAGKRAAHETDRRKLELRTDIALGKVVRRLAPDHVMLRRLVSTVRDEVDQDDVRQQLSEIAGDAPSLDDDVARLVDVTNWRKLRALHAQLLNWWDAISPLDEGKAMPLEAVDPNDILMIEALAADIDAITGGSHPAGRAARKLFARMLPGFVDDEMGVPGRLDF